ncbi:CehA/McbA family metallohydrolase [Planctomycetota bacterium]
MRRFFLSLVIAGCATAAAAEEPVIGDPIGVVKGPEHEYPAIAVAGQEVWVAWSRLGPDDRERVFMRRMEPLGEEIAVSPAGFEYAPELTFDGQRLWIFWCARRDGNWDIYGRAYSGELSEEVRLSSHSGEDFHPRAVGDKGTTWLAWESVRKGRLQVMTRIHEREWGKELAVPVAAEHAIRPSVAPGWVAWEEFGHDHDSDIRLASWQEGRWEARDVTTHPARDAAPSIAVDHNRRVWVAWHSNRHQSSWDVPRWVMLRCWDGRWLEPVTQSPRVLDEQNPVQSFEFPNLLIDSSNRVWVFGRPSHGFYAQYYHREAWSKIHSLEALTWGCRGRDVRAVEYGDTILTVRRKQYEEPYGVVLQKITAPNDPGEPVLVEASESPGELERDRPLRRRHGEYGVYFGDLHTHSWYSDGIGTPDEIYLQSRDIFGWDFCALADHEWFMQNPLTPCEWHYLKTVTRTFDEPGRFATLPAYEWTSPNVRRKGSGHKNVYFKNDNHPIFSLRRDAKTTAELFEELRKVGAMAIPHHVGWTGTDWHNHDATVQRNAEIVSAHGAFEYMGNRPIKHRGATPGHFIQDGLARGGRFGVVGGSDSHGLLYHHSIGRKRNPWLSGLTGVLARELSREAVYEALFARRCFATSGVRITAVLQANDVYMGGELETDEPPTLRYEVIGTAPIRFVTIVKNNEDWIIAGPEGALSTEARGTYTDEAVDDATHYYLRVVQEDGEVAWTSPVWVDRPQGRGR